MKIWVKGMHLQGCQDPVYFNTAGKFLDGFRAAIVFQHGPDEHVAEIVHGNKGKTTVFCNMLQSRIQGHQCFYGAAAADTECLRIFFIRMLQKIMVVLHLAERKFVLYEKRHLQRTETFFIQILVTVSGRSIFSGKNAVFCILFMNIQFRGIRV